MRELSGLEGPWLWTTEAPRAPRAASVDGAAPPAAAVRPAADGRFRLATGEEARLWLEPRALRGEAAERLPPLHRLPQSHAKVEVPAGNLVAPLRQGLTRCAQVPVSPSTSCWLGGGQASAQTSDFFPWVLDTGTATSPARSNVAGSGHRETSRRGAAHSGRWGCPVSSARAALGTCGCGRRWMWLKVASTTMRGRWGGLTEPVPRRGPHVHPARGSETWGGSFSD